MPAFEGDKHVVYKSDDVHVAVRQDDVVEFYFGTVALLFSMNGFISFSQAVVRHCANQKLNTNTTDLFINTPCAGVSLRIPGHDIERFERIMRQSVVEVILIRELSLLKEV